jgi:tetratricopeptide (TPR) repeat protein
MAEILIEVGDTAALDSLLRLAGEGEDWAFPRAYLSLKRGEETFDSLLSLVREKRKKAWLLLQAKRYRDALKVLEDVEDPKGLLLKAWAYIGLEEWLRARELLKGKLRGRLADSLRFQLAYNLFRHGLFKEAYEILDLIRDYTPTEEIYDLKVSLLKKLGRTEEADSLIDWLSRWGKDPLLYFTAEELLPAFNRFYQGASPYEVARELFRLGAYRDVVNLLSTSRDLKPRERLILADCLMRIYRATRDTLFAKRADSLYLTLPTLPEGYWLLHMYWKTASARVPASPPGFLSDTALVGYITALSANGRVEDAKNLALSLASDMRNRAFFLIYMEGGELDSAFSKLDLKVPYQVIRLAEAFYERGRFEACGRLLKLLPVSGLKLEEEARYLEVLSLAELGDWKEVERVALDFLKRFPWSDRRKDVAERAVFSLLKLGMPERALYLAWKEKLEDGFKMTLLALDDEELKRDLLQSPDKDWLSAIEKRDWKALSSIEMTRDTHLLRLAIEGLLESGEDSLASQILQKAESEGYLRGNSLRMLKYLREALSDTVRGLDLGKGIEDKLRGEFYYRFGLLSFKRGNKKRARSAFFKAFQWASGEVRGKVAFKLATLLFRERRYEEALDYYRMAYELLKDKKSRMNALHNMAVVYGKLNRPDSALIAYTALVDSFPNTEDALSAKFSIGYRLMEKGRFEEALEIFQSLRGFMKNAEEEAERTYWEARVAFALREFEAAIHNYRILRESYGNVGDWGITGEIELARVLALSGGVEEAKSIYEGILKRRGETDPFGQIAKEELEKLK